MKPRLSHSAAIPTYLLSESHAFERLYLAADGAFGGEALDAGGAEEAGDAGHHLQGRYRHFRARRRVLRGR